MKTRCFSFLLRNLNFTLQVRYNTDSLPSYDMLIDESVYSSTTPLTTPTTIRNARTKSSGIENVANSIAEGSTPRTQIDFGFGVIEKPNPTAIRHEDDMSPDDIDRGIEFNGVFSFVILFFYLTIIFWAFLSAPKKIMVSSVFGFWFVKIFFLFFQLHLMTFYQMIFMKVLKSMLIIV